MTSQIKLLQPTTSPKQYRHLFAEIDKGELKIPNFQRDFVWTKEQTAKLIDSIIRGYPIGAFIFWKTKERLRHIKNIGNVSLPEPDKTDYISYILDGQQRITSLYAMRAGIIYTTENGIEINYKDIYIDLEVDINSEKDIVVTENISKYCVSVYDILNEKLAILFKKYQEFAEKIEAYKNNLEGYNFSTITLPEYPMDIACDVFTRLNTGGTALNLFEIMVAKTYDEQREFDLSKKFSELVHGGKGKKCLEDSKFDTISGILVIQCISAILNGEVKRKDILQIEKNNFINTWEIMQEALFLAVDFIRSKLGVVVSQLLPYQSLLIPITYFFAKNNFRSPSPTQVKLIRQYFYWASLTWRFSSAAEGKIALDIKKMNLIIREKKPKYGNEMISVDPESILETWFSVGNAYCKAILCLFSSMEPRSFDTDSITILDNSYLKQANSRNYHHFFPKAYLEKKGYEPYQSNSIANITLIDGNLNKNEIRAKSPSKYISVFLKENENIHETLKTHLIDLDTFGIFDDNYDTFLEERSKLIAKKINMILNYIP